MRAFRTVRSARSRTRLFAATGVAIAALALTACNDGTGAADAGPAQSGSSAIGGSGSTGATPPASKPTVAPANGGSSGNSGSSDKGGTTGSNSKSGSSSGSGSNPWDPENRVLCSGSNTQVTAEPVSSPVNHMLLTVKNTGSKYCDLTYYPVIRFDEMQWAPQAVKDSKPQAVVTLAPGESGYAGVLLEAADGSGDGGTTGHKLTVFFQGKAPNSNGGATALPSLPAKGVYYDSSLQVTYWQQTAKDALTW
jgi:hypothetical protein